MLADGADPPNATTPGRPTRLAILISGTGSNCTAIAKAIRSGRLRNCEIAIVISNVPGAAGIESARALGLSVVTLEGRGREQRDHEDAIAALLRKFRVDLVCLAGYKRVLSAAFVREWKGRMVSIQSSLLPAFQGPDAQRQALDYGSRFTGCTVYFVEEHVEAGAIIAKRVVEIEDGDSARTLREALRAEEHIAYVDAIERVLSGDFETHGRRYMRKSAEASMQPEAADTQVAGK